MLHFLTDRNSKFVKLVEFAGVILFCCVVIFKKGPHAAAYAPSLAIFFGLYLAIRFCATWNWYRKFVLPKPVNEFGIRVHLRKTLVTTAYLLLIVSGLLLVGVGVWATWVASLIYVGALYVNLTLIYMHLRDNDSTPPNFFSKSFVSDIEALEEDRLKNFFPKPKDLV